jgi:hypothetical protein
MKPILFCASSRPHAFLLYLCLPFAIAQTAHVQASSSASIPDQEFRRRFPARPIEWQSFSHTASLALRPTTTPCTHLYLRGGGSKKHMGQKGKKPRGAPAFVSGGVLKRRGAPRRNTNKQKLPASSSPTKATQQQKKKKGTKSKLKPKPAATAEPDMDSMRVERQKPQHKTWRDLPPANPGDVMAPWPSDFSRKNRNLARSQRKYERKVKLRREVAQGAVLLDNMHEILRGINKEEIVHVFEHKHNVDAKASEILAKFQQNFERFGLEKLDGLLPNENEVVVSREEEESVTKSGEDQVEDRTVST